MRMETRIKWGYAGQMELNCCKQRDNKTVPETGEETHFAVQIIRNNGGGEHYIRNTSNPYSVKLQ